MHMNGVPRLWGEVEIFGLADKRLVILVVEHVICHEANK